MKNMMIALIIGLAASSSALAKEETHGVYYKRAVAVLQAQGYQDIKIVGQKQGNCMMSATNEYFDFNAAIFKATKEGKKVDGVVCRDKVYLSGQS